MAVYSSPEYLIDFHGNRLEITRKADGRIGYIDLDGQADEIEAQAARTGKLPEWVIDKALAELASWPDEPDAA